MIKPVLSCFFILFSGVCFSQGVYTITWKKEGDSWTGTASDPKGSTIEFEKIPQNKQLEIYLSASKADIEALKVKVEGDTFIDVKGFLKEKEDDLMLEVVPKGDKPVKMQIGENPKHIAYPYEFELMLKAIKEPVKLNIGETNLKALKNEAEPCELPNILAGIVTTPSNESPRDCAFYQSKMDQCNVIIAIDASSFVSGRSQLYRKSCCSKDNKKECNSCGCKKGIWVGDYVKIYLENFNPYRYEATIAAQEVDAQFDKAKALFEQSGKEQKSGGADAVGYTGDNTCLLKKYAHAAIQLKAYIDFVKNNTQPEYQVLEANKASILVNLANAHLTGTDIGVVIANLDASGKTNLKAEIELAQFFPALRAELLMLTYVVEGTILPIKVRSFDKLEFTVTLKDRTSKNILSTRIYEYLIKGGLKVDQSFGVVFHKIRNQEFDLRSLTEKETTYAKTSTGEIIKKWNSTEDSISSITDVDKREIIQAESPDKYSIGASTLTHLYYRTCLFNRVRLGLGPEVGLSADVYPETAIRYLAGFGLSFYDGRHRISLDAGWAFGKYKVLGNGQENGTKLIGKDAQPTLVDRTGRSFYFGISYNIPLIKNDTQNEK